MKILHLLDYNMLILCASLQYSSFVHSFVISSLKSGKICCDSVKISRFEVLSLICPYSFRTQIRPFFFCYERQSEYCSIDFLWFCSIVDSMHYLDLIWLSILYTIIDILYSNWCFDSRFLIVIDRMSWRVDFMSCMLKFFF